MRFGWIEAIAMEAIIFIALWIWNPYLAFLLTCVIIPILFSIWLISVIADLLDKSKIGRGYYIFLWASILLLALIMGGFIIGGVDIAKYFES